MDEAISSGAILRVERLGFVTVEVDVDVEAEAGVVGESVWSSSSEGDVKPDCWDCS